jgi:hypothetical protein
MDNLGMQENTVDEYKDVHFLNVDEMPSYKLRYRLGHFDMFARKIDDYEWAEHGFWDMAIVSVRLRQDSDLIGVCVHEGMKIPFYHYDVRLVVLGWLWSLKEQSPRVICFVPEVCRPLNAKGKTLAGDVFRAIPISDIDWAVLVASAKQEEEYPQYWQKLKILSETRKDFHDCLPTKFTKGIENLELLAVKRRSNVLEHDRSANTDDERPTTKKKPEPAKLSKKQLSAIPVDEHHLPSQPKTSMKELVSKTSNQAAEESVTMLSICCLLCVNIRIRSTKKGSRRQQATRIRRRHKRLHVSRRQSSEKRQGLYCCSTLLKMKYPR